MQYNDICVYITCYLAGICFVHDRMDSSQSIFSTNNVLHFLSFKYNQHINYWLCLCVYIVLLSNWHICKKAISFQI